MIHRVEEVMTAGVKVISPTATIVEAARLMKETDIGVLPVCDERGLTGMVTDRDIVTRVVAMGMSPQLTTVQEILTAPIITCRSDQDIFDVARIMEAHQVRRLAVLDHDGVLVGIVTLGDLAVRAGRDDVTAEVLERVSEPGAQDVA